MKSPLPTPLLLFLATLFFSLSAVRAQTVPKTDYRIPKNAWEWVFRTDESNLWKPEADKVKPSQILDYYRQHVREFETIPADDKYSSGKTMAVGTLFVLANCAYVEKAPEFEGLFSRAKSLAEALADSANQSNATVALAAPEPLIRSFMTNGNFERLLDTMDWKHELLDRYSKNPDRDSEWRSFKFAEEIPVLASETGSRWIGFRGP